jgi:hypothetical protein
MERMSELAELKVSIVPLKRKVTQVDAVYRPSTSRFTQFGERLEVEYK